MISKRKVKAQAKEMFKKSLTDEMVDAKKVTGNLKEIASQKPAGLTTTLKAYKRLIAEALSKEELTLETAAKLPNIKPIEAELLAKTGARRVKYKLNPKLVFGVRVKHADWIFDASLDAKLNSLTQID